MGSPLIDPPNFVELCAELCESTSLDRASIVKAISACAEPARLGVGEHQVADAGGEPLVRACRSWLRLSLRVATGAQREPGRPVWVVLGVKPQRRARSKPASGT
jgi:hypothetical protein